MRKGLFHRRRVRARIRIRRFLQDPVTHERSEVPVYPRDPATPDAGGSVLASSPYWGDEPIWNSQTNVHNPMFDEDGRVWLTSRVRPANNPDFCKEGSEHPSARLFPLARSYRHLAVYDPATEELTNIGTCFSTHHLMFAMDEQNTLWTSGDGQVVGWLDVEAFLETGDEETSQGWTGASTIRKQSGRAAGREPRSVRARHSTWNRAPGRPARCTSSRCGPILWRNRK